MSAWDKGKSAARRGLGRKSNPYNHPDRQTGSSMDWERLASEWDEGFDGFDSEQDAKERSERARKAALTRWQQTTAVAACGEPEVTI